DVERCKLNCRGANEAQLPRLAGSVVAPARVTGDRTGDGRCNHDTSLSSSFQRRQTSLHREKGSLQIHIENLVPISLAHIEEFCGRENSCVATEDVDTAVPIDRSLSHADVVFHPGYVH